jgi:hypothetical protein
MKLTKENCQELLSRQDIEVQRYVAAMLMELEKATEKHPNWPKDKVHAAAIVTEESGELMRAALQFHYEEGRYYDMHKEAIQTGAMCIRFLINAPEMPFDH